jgi:hypothetical protein
MGWTIRGSNPGMGEKFFSSPDSVYWVAGFFPGVKQPGLHVEQLHLVPRVKMSGITPLLPKYMPSRRGQAQLQASCTQFHVFAMTRTATVC